MITLGKYVRVWRSPQGLPLVVEKRLRGVVSKENRVSLRGVGVPSW